MKGFDDERTNSFDNIKKKKLKKLIAAQFIKLYLWSILIGHKMISYNVQNSSGTTNRRRVVSLPSFEHFMASFYCL